MKFIPFYPGYILAFLGLLVLFWLLPYRMGDWTETFYQVGKMPLHPYAIPTFINIPWIVLFLLPFQFFTEHFGQAINGSISIAVIGALILKRGGNPVSFFLTFTSLPFLMMLDNGQVEWIPAIGFLIGNEWGLLFMMVKPQSGILVAFDWFLSSKNKIIFSTLPIIALLISLVVWSDWPSLMLTNVRLAQAGRMSSWNFAIFPWSIPAGLALLFYVARCRPKDSELLATLATFCLVPYFAIHSLTICFCLLAASHHRLAIAAWFLLWLIPILSGA